MLLISVLYSCKPTFTPANECQQAHQMDKCVLKLNNYEFNLTKHQTANHFHYNGQLKHIKTDDCYYTSTNPLGSFWICNGIYGSFIENGTHYEVNHDGNGLFGDVEIKQVAHVPWSCPVKDVQPPIGIPCQQTEKTHLLHKRDATTKVIELAVYLDASYYKSIGEYSFQTAQVMVNGAVNLYLNNDGKFKDGNSLHLQPNVILQLDTDPTDGILGVNEGLVAFNAFANQFKSQFQDDFGKLLQSDANILLSNRPTNPPNNNGVAKFGELCIGGENGVYVANVNAHTILTTSRTIAHELGHLVRAKHDGMDNNCPSTGYIMSAVSTDGENIEMFSSCSISEIDDGTGDKSCLDSQLDVSGTANYVCQGYNCTLQ
eukprot:NODE_237_length_11991_cov_1.642899.p5 type:complete len:373 gc:universal NODE_237_length_11991_cov_1.642899:6294-7412(+)